MIVGTLQGFSGSVGFGERPAILVVDMSHGFTRPGSPLACHVQIAVPSIAQLLDCARAHDFPIFYTTISYDESGISIAANFLSKLPALEILRKGSDWVEIDERIKPHGEPVLVKLFASAFFGTPLSALLSETRVDTLIVTGASTSGCVRASVVDALQEGLRPIVPLEAVADRDTGAHTATLSDLQKKYADVLPLADVIRYLEGESTSSNRNT